MSWLIALLALLLGFLISQYVGSLRGGGDPSEDRPVHPAPELEHFLELLVKAHSGIAACAVTELGSEAVTGGQGKRQAETVSRMLSTTRLALSDGRTHLLRNGATVIGIGGSDVAVGFAFSQSSPDSATVQTVWEDLKRLLKALRGGTLLEGAGAAWLRPVSRDQTVGGIAQSLCESVRELTSLSCGVALVEAGAEELRMVAVSQGADRRLLGAHVSWDSAAGRAVRSEAPVASNRPADLIGQERGDRRREHEEGLAFPIVSHQGPIGSLTLFGRLGEMDKDPMGRLQSLLIDHGERLGTALSIRAAEIKALTDHLTGLPNRRALERAMSLTQNKPTSLVILDLDHFKRINDEEGHPAGDEVLKRVALVLRESLREGDLAARVGGEEFALWLPLTPLEEAKDVAERLRATLEQTTVNWGGGQLSVTGSFGVSTYPDSVSELNNLYATADAALYRAKEAGRNRVEVANGGR